MVVTVRTQWVTLPSRSRGPQHQFKVIQGASQLFVEFDGTILGKAVGLVTVRTVQAAWLGLEGAKKERGLLISLAVLPQSAKLLKGFHIIPAHL